MTTQAEMIAAVAKDAGVSQADALDCVITNALVVDYTGIYKADIGIKNGVIAGIGWGAMVALALLVEPNQREMTVRIPANKLDPR